MNMQAMRQAMMRSISEVLEQMFFLPIEIQESSDLLMPESPQPPQIDILAGVGFQGPARGRFVLSIPSDLAASMAIDFLGTSAESITTDQIAATVKEMVNMLAGNALSAYDPESAFDLQIPELIASSIPQADATEKEISIDLIVETPESRMAFQLMAESTEPAM